MKTRKGRFELPNMGVKVPCLTTWRQPHVKSHRVAHEKSEAWWVLLLTLLLPEGISPQLRGLNY